MFSVASVRKMIDDALIHSPNLNYRWNKYVPIKVNILVWKILNNSLPTKFNISRRGILIDSIICPNYDVGVESVGHLFFSCSMSRDIFNLIARRWKVSIENFDCYDEWLEWIDSIRMSKKTKIMMEAVRFQVQLSLFELSFTDLEIRSFSKKKKIVNTHHKEVLNALTPKGAELSASDAEHDDNDNGSSYGFEGLNYGGFTEEETKILESKIRKQVGKAIKNVMPFYISQTTDNLKEVVRKELEEFRRGGMMNDFRNEMATYNDFTACDVPKFDGTLDPIAYTKWLSFVEGAFRTSCCTCTWKEFKEIFNTKYASAEEVDKIREEFQTLTQTSETVNELWKKFNDLIRYCPEYHENEKLKVKKFQRIIPDDIREVIFPFKCTTLDDLLSRARVREANLLRKKNKEAKETKRKLDFIDRDAKKPKQDQSRRSGGTQVKSPCKKCHKTQIGVCRANLSGCYKCGALNHMSKDYKKAMILCYNFNQLGHKSNECPNPKVIEAKPLKSIKEEKVEKTGIPTLMARAYMMATE
uniref:Zinc finger, CCHC-type, retrotransposon Gag domain protein n=1 Tax=Tanacetum cinerariifolium TaxID=118510 RepID=A0A699HCK7_TANCI|nr:zinc finger, CCHC-type, retrotransposon Gag domain protein [Tanacetum cinerariifolium]